MRLQRGGRFKTRECIVSASLPRGELPLPRASFELQEASKSTKSIKSWEELGREDASSETASEGTALASKCGGRWEAANNGQFTSYLCALLSASEDDTDKSQRPKTTETHPEGLSVRALPPPAPHRTHYLRGSELSRLRVVLLP
ncbi:hypothetical protein cyc_08460 [Cyclospora cayetanensis]|uniref:Uncharacterized protein n=1 Tax=Cyclospora cayetanensis TaxID=88456 RepID=A0A1D3D6M8_9EIME|nr:hypothetical protein cyc_08460 [Cyclospora cayetanensis]